VGRVLREGGKDNQNKNARGHDAHARKKKNLRSFKTREGREIAVVLRNAGGKGREKKHRLWNGSQGPRAAVKKNLQGTASETRANEAS